MKTKSKNLSVLAAVCAAILIWPLSPHAQQIKPDPDPGISGEGFVDYVGHFGEIFKLRGGWKIAPSMQGKVEVISFFPEYRPDRPPESLERFQPKATDFAPENFTRLQLIQLVIIPRSSDAFHSLDELKEAKVKDLRASGVKFEVFDDPYFGEFFGNWPRGTFEIRVSAPYRLSQLYTADQSHLCILTSGIDIPPSDEIRRYYGFLRSGLASWIVPQREVVQDDEATTRDIWSKGISLHPFAIPAIWMTWVGITGIACLFAGVLGLKKRWDPLRRASLSLLIFSNVGALLGGLCGALLWSFPRLTRHVPASAAVACLFMPILALCVGRVRGVAAHRRALIGSSLYALIALVFLAYCSMFDWGHGSRYIPSVGAILSFVSYGIGGIIFGVLDSACDESVGSGSLSMLLILLFLAPRAWSQSSNDDGLDAKARANLAASGVTEASLKKTAMKNLSRTQVLFDFQRVEIKGILSPGGAGSANDTNKSFGPLFDKQIAPSHIGETDTTMPSWMQPVGEVYSGLKDFKDLREDAYNDLSATAKQVVQDLKDKNVNEIVAHSWGTEIVYNAILAGEIRAPRRLIVCGMPDHDLAKWKALSKYTGTEVIVYTDTHDPWAAGPRIIGGTLSAAEEITARTGLEAALPYNSAQFQKYITPDASKFFDQQWATECQKRGDCNPYKRTPPETHFKSVYKGASHDRLNYYEAMQGGGDLPTCPATDAVFAKCGAFPGSALALQAAQDAKINNAAHNLYVVALSKEREALKADDNGGAGASAFFNSAAEGQGIVNAVVALNKENVVLTQHIQQMDLEYADRQKVQKFREDLIQHIPDFRYLAEAARLACVSPDALRTEVSQGRYIDLTMEHVYLAASLDMVAADMSPCDLLLLNKIKDSENPITWRELIALGNQYRYEHRDFLQRVGDGLTDALARFGAALQDIRSNSGTAGDYSDGGYSGGGGGQRVNSGSVGMTEAQREQNRASLAAQTRDEQYIADKAIHGYTGKTPDNWSSLNHLRGVASSGGGLP